MSQRDTSEWILQLFSLEESFVIFPFEASASVCLVMERKRIHYLLLSLEIMFVDLISCL